MRLERLVLGSAALALLSAVPLAAQPIRAQDIPPALRPWTAWVLDEVPDAACPASGAEALCLWPGRLQLDLASSAGGTFALGAYADRALPLLLPGDLQRWPQDVRLDGRGVPVTQRNGLPSLVFPAGAHRVEGRFLWGQLPDSLPVPPAVALVGLTLDGRLVALPQRDAAGLLWLRREGPKGAQGVESLRLKVFRKVTDGVPVFVDTRVVLEIGGRAREVELRGALLEHARPVAVEGDLPARLDGTGRLRIQVRAGSFTVSLRSRMEGDPKSVGVPVTAPPWPEEETWAFEADEQIRQVQVSGAPAVDPSRTDLPEEWRVFPAYSLKKGGHLDLQQVRRGEAVPAPDQIRLQREFWLDLSGRGLTVRDVFSGAERRSGRLDLMSPGQLGRVAVDNVEQLVTLNPLGALAGVEVRREPLSLVADSRLPGNTRRMRAVGWSASVEGLQATLHVPPGWSLLAATGVDSAPGAWIQRWTLLGLFFVVLVAFGTGRLLGARSALLALLAIGLSYHEPGAPLPSWLSLLAAAAVLRAAPEGRVRQAARLWWWASAVALVLTLAPFYRDQIREALFPQVAETRPTHTRAGLADGLQAVPAAPAPAPAMVERDAGTAYTEGRVAGGVAGRMAAPRPQPRREMKTKGPAQESLKLSRESVAVGAEPQAQGILNSFLAQDPHAVLQTGPGIPSWSWQSYVLGWSGPVSRDHAMSLYLLSPRMNLLLAVVRLLGLGVLAWRLARHSLAEATGRPPSGTALAAGAVFLLAVGCPLAARAQSPEPARAPAERSESLPGPGLLTELRKRLTRPEACAPECATTASLLLRIEGTTLSFAAEVHAGAPVGWALPGPAGSWVPATVLVDGAASTALAQRPDGFLYVRLGSGVHRLEASGPLPPQDTLTLQFQDRPRRARAEAPGWEVVGLREDGAADAQVQLTRRLPSPGGIPTAAGSYPPWLEVHRTLNLGVSWYVQTVVSRVSPVGTPVSVRIPLLADESPTTPELQVQNGEVLLGLGRDEEEASWTSTLKPSDVVKLVAAEGRPFSEVWTTQCSVLVECRAEGLPPTTHREEGLESPAYRPWPGESLTLRIQRPAGAPGASLTLDRFELQATPGQRLETAVLKITARASRDEPLELTLPSGVEVQSVLVGGKPQPSRPEGGRLRLTLPRGSPEVEVRWHQDRGLSPVYGVPRVGLSSPTVNASVRLALPEDRWLLFTRGPAWGPAVLFWGYLLFASVVAVLLGRIPGSPLTASRWWLLALGLTQIPAVSALVVVAFFFVTAWRQGRPAASPLAHDALQVLIAVWALVALLCLYDAIQTGLLLRPDMQVAGGGSTATQLRWYVDRLEGPSPGAGVVSLPLWVYRVAMLLWSLWLAASLVSWSAWTWRCLNEGGLWKPLGKGRPAPPAAEPKSPGGTGEGPKA